MRQLTLFAALVAGCLAVASGSAQSAESATFDDTARFLAGMEPSAGSPLAPLTQDASWKQHAAAMNKAFSVVDKSQLSTIRDWSKENLTSPKPTLFYMFSGPDYLYAGSFFPNATNYVLAGLEPAGQIPDVLALHQRGGLPGLSSLQHSMRTLLAVSFFITKDMGSDLSSTALRGTLPILYVFMVRSGKQIRDVSLIDLDEQGEPMANAGNNPKSGARGVKIVFGTPGGPDQTLYYFSTNLANGSVKSSGFLKFLEKFGPADSMVKSASYLLHYNDFTQIREFLIDHSSTILQDDSGIPIRYLQGYGWGLHAYGHYTGALGIFPGTFQTEMRDLFAKQATPLKFGYGYRWRPTESNVLIAVKGEVPVVKQEPPKSPDVVARKPFPRSVEREASIDEDRPGHRRPRSIFGTPQQDVAARPAYPLFPASRH